MASKTFATALSSSLVIFSLAGCNKSASTSSPPPANPIAQIFASVPSGKPTTPPPAPERRTALIAAAERFENLTEAAFSTDPAEVAKRTALANAAGAAVRSGMSPDHGAGLDAALGKITLAGQTKSAADLSLASNDAYRAVLSEAGGEPTVPLDIGLLDYAGFRILADARDPEQRWDDVRETLGFANQRWNAVKPLIKDAHVRDQFDRTLVWAQEAAAAKDAKSLERAATRELDLVDILETAVKPR